MTVHTHSIASVGGKGSIDSIVDSALHDPDLFLKTIAYFRNLDRISAYIKSAIPLWHPLCCHHNSRADDLIHVSSEKIFWSIAPNI